MDDQSYFNSFVKPLIKFATNANIVVFDADALPEELTPELFFHMDKTFERQYKLNIDTFLLFNEKLTKVDTWFIRQPLSDVVIRYFPNIKDMVYNYFFNKLQGNIAERDKHLILGYNMSKAILGSY